MAFAATGMLALGLTIVILPRRLKRRIQDMFMGKHNLARRSRSRDARWSKVLRTDDDEDSDIEGVREDEEQEGQDGHDAQAVPKRKRATPRTVTACVPLVKESVGSSKEATARCYCGRVQLKVAPAAGKPLESTVCHCKSCQRASGAPMVLSVTTMSSEVIVLDGGELLTHRNDVRYSPDGFLINKATGAGYRRQFCSNCGTQMRIKRTDPASPPGARARALTTTFPATYDEHLDDMVTGWQPTMHINCNDHCIEPAAFNDGLPKRSHVAEKDGAYHQTR